MRVRLENAQREFDLDPGGHLLAEGGEGRIYVVPGAPEAVIKIYKKDAEDRRRKLELMLANPPADDDTPGHTSIAWPTDLVRDGRGRFIGFAMKRLGKAFPLN